MVGSMTVLEENTLPFARIPRFLNKPTHPATRCFLLPSQTPSRGRKGFSAGEHNVGLGTEGHLTQVLLLGPATVPSITWACQAQCGHQ